MMAKLILLVATLQPDWVLPISVATLGNYLPLKKKKKWWTEWL